MTARELDDLVASAKAPTPEDAKRLREFAERVETERRAADSRAREAKR